MVVNKVKRNLADGRRSVGVWIEVMSADIVEICGYLGFDYAIFDAEHFALDPVASVALIRACELTDMVPMVRVPSNQPSVILGYLEVGCRGIYVPHVNCQADARAIIDAVKYPPAGRRGAGFGRHAHWGIGELSRKQMIDELNEATLVIALVEEEEGVRNIDQIVAMDGIDVVAIGSGDLSNSMGYVGESNHPEVVRTVRDLEQRILAGGKTFESLVTTVAEARDEISRGSRMVTVALRNVLRGNLAALQREISQIA